MVISIWETTTEILKKEADKKAVAEYDAFNKNQKINAVFDKQIKKMMKWAVENNE